jgi:hypothetical protein
VPRARLGEDLQRGELVPGFERPVGALVPQLDDVDAAGEGRVGELGEVTGAAAGAGAEVEAGVVQSLAHGGAVEGRHDPRRYAEPPPWA